MTTATAGARKTLSSTKALRSSLLLDGPFMSLMSFMFAHAPRLTHNNRCLGSVWPDKGLNHDRAHEIRGLGQPEAVPPSRVIGQICPGQDSALFIPCRFAKLPVQAALKRRDTAATDGRPTAEAAEPPDTGRLGYGAGAAC